VVRLGPGALVTLPVHLPGLAEFIFAAADERSAMLRRPQKQSELAWGAKALAPYVEGGKSPDEHVLFIVQSLMDLYVDPALVRDKSAVQKTGDFADRTRQTRRSCENAHAVSALPPV
jgi:hypothetical protein